MLQIFVARRYCNLAAKEALLKSLNKTEITNKLDFKILRHPTKVPITCIVPIITKTGQQTQAIDTKTIQLLERLSLVDLDSKSALETLNNSIQFGDKVVDIDTTNIAPIYTVLENENLQLREDLASEGNCRHFLQQIAKVTDEDYYVSPPGNIPLEQEDKSFINAK